MSQSKFNQGSATYSSLFPWISSHDIGHQMWAAHVQHPWYLLIAALTPESNDHCCAVGSWRGLWASKAGMKFPCAPGLCLSWARLSGEQPTGSPISSVLLLGFWKCLSQTALWLWTAALTRDSASGPSLLTTTRCRVEAPDRPAGNTVSHSTFCAWPLNDGQVSLGTKSVV